jgi:hypothetical protein
MMMRFPMCLLHNEHHTRRRQERACASGNVGIPKRNCGGSIGRSLCETSLIGAWKNARAYGPGRLAFLTSKGFANE